jgi:adenosine deaminase
MEEAEKDFPIKVRYLVSINRQAGAEAAQNTLSLLSEV